MRAAIALLLILLVPCAAAEIYLSDEGMLVGPPPDSGSSGGGGGGGGGGGVPRPSAAAPSGCTGDCSTAAPSAPSSEESELPTIPTGPDSEGEEPSSPPAELEAPSLLQKHGRPLWINALLVTMLGTLVAAFVVLATVWDNRGKERFYHARKLLFGRSYFLVRTEEAQRIAHGAARFDPVLLLTAMEQSAEKGLTMYSIGQSAGENTINPSEIELLNEKTDEFTIANASGIIVLDCLDLIIEGTNRQSAVELIRIIKSKLGTSYMLIISTRSRTRAEELREALHDLFDEWR